MDWKFNRPGELLRQLNAFVQHRNEVRAPGDTMDANFTNTDIDKLAFWMATGAGKTLIMHINYHQFLHYCKIDRQEFAEDWHILFRTEGDPTYLLPIFQEQDLPPI